MLLLLILSQKTGEFTIIIKHLVFLTIGSMENQFTYKTKNGDLKSYSIPDKAFNLFSQALIDYKTAKDYIYSTWIHTWNF